MLDILAPWKLPGDFFWISHARPVLLGAKIGPKSPPQQAVAFVEGSGCFLIFRSGGVKKGTHQTMPGYLKRRFPDDVHMQIDSHPLWPNNPDEDKGHCLGA